MNANAHNNASAASAPACACTLPTAARTRSEVVASERSATGTGPLVFGVFDAQALAGVVGGRLAAA